MRPTPLRISTSCKPHRQPSCHHHWKRTCMDSASSKLRDCERVPTKLHLPNEREDLKSMEKEGTWAKTTIPMWAAFLQTIGIETLGSTYARSFLIACPLILQHPNDSAGHSMLAKRDCFTRMFSCVRNCNLMAIQYECQRTVWHCSNLRFKFLIQRSLIAQRHDNPLQLDSSQRCWHCSYVLLEWSRLMFVCTLPCGRESMRYQWSLKP